MKTMKYVLIVLGAIFAFYLIRAVIGGFSSTANPGAMIEKARDQAESQQR